MFSPIFAFLRLSLCLFAIIGFAFLLDASSIYGPILVLVVSIFFPVLSFVRAGLVLFGAIGALVLAEQTGYYGPGAMLLASVCFLNMPRFWRWCLVDEKDPELAS